MIEADMRRAERWPITLLVLVLSLGLLQCAALDDSGQPGSRDGVASQNSHEGVGQPWYVKILSPFPYEPVERADFKVSVDVSALPFPCSVEVLLNGHTVVSYALEHAPLARNASWNWNPTWNIIQDLDGFNGLEVVARQAVCARDTGRPR